MDGLRHPIERHVGQQFIFAETALHVAITVRPVAKFLDDPGGQRGGRIVQTVGRGLGRVALQVGVGPKIGVPAIGVVQEALLDFR